MATPNDPKKAPERELPPDSGDPTPHPRYDEQLEGDAFEVMRKYHVVTLPPNARLELMKMKLPEAPPELLQDTVPPNGNVKGPARDEHATTTDVPVVDVSRSNDTLIIPRVQKHRQQRLRTVVIACVCAAIALVALGVLVSSSGGETDEPITVAPSEPQLVPAETPTSTTAKPAAQMAAQPDTSSARPPAASPPDVQKQPARTTTHNDGAPKASAPSKVPATTNGATPADPSKPSAAPPSPKTTSSKAPSALDGLIRPPSE